MRNGTNVCKVSRYVGTARADNTQQMYLGTLQWSHLNPAADQRHTAVHLELIRPIDSTDKDPCTENYQNFYTS